MSNGTKVNPIPFTHLPELVLLHIATHLPTNDACILSLTCNRMKNLLPNHSYTIYGPDVKEDGPSDGHWCPSRYFDSPKLQSTVEKIVMGMTWRDQVIKHTNLN